VRRREFISLLGGAAVGWPVAAKAQQAGIVPRIGLLYSGLSGATPAVLEGFRQGLRERGYVEPKIIAIEYRFDEGNLDRLPNLAAELVGMKVDVTSWPREVRRRSSLLRTPPAQFLSSFQQ
jgi:putative tryptophan/tyrosine transport system substrate-binding protein